MFAWNETHANNTPATLPEQWLDWGDVTMQIDPMGNKQWIHDSHDGHARSTARGLRFDAREVNELLGWEKNCNPQPLDYYVPSTSLIDGLDKYSEPMGHGCRMWRGNTRTEGRYGMLPTIEAMKYDNTLQNKSIGDINNEILYAEKRIANRLFDKSGKCR